MRFCAYERRSRLAQINEPWLATASLSKLLEYEQIESSFNATFFWKKGVENNVACYFMLEGGVECPQSPGFDAPARVGYKLREHWATCISAVYFL